MNKKGTTMNIATSRYRDYRPEWGVAVRITVGRAHFFTHPHRKALALAPYELFSPPYKGINDIDTEQRVYRQRLDRHEQRILDQLRTITADHPGQRLVLLCFEDVHAGEACHRRWAADWLSERFGWDVPEIRPDNENGNQTSQTVLF